MKIYSNEYYEKTPSREFRIGLESFIECAIWADTNEEKCYSVGDITPESLAYCIESFIDFIGLIPALDLEAYRNEHDMSQLGHDFWLTTNGHGTGFWGRSYPEQALGDRLTSLCKGWSFTIMDIDDDTFEIS